MTMTMMVLHSDAIPWEGDERSDMVDSDDWALAVVLTTIWMMMMMMTMVVMEVGSVGDGVCPVDDVDSDDVMMMMMPIMVVGVVVVCIVVVVVVVVVLDACYDTDVDADADDADDGRMVAAVVVQFDSDDVDDDMEVIVDRAMWILIGMMLMVSMFLLAIDSDPSSSLSSCNCCDGVGASVEKLMMDRVVRTMMMMTTMVERSVVDVVGGGEMLISVDNANDDVGKMWCCWLEWSMDNGAVAGQMRAMVHRMRMMDGGGVGDHCIVCGAGEGSCLGFVFCFRFGFLAGRVFQSKYHQKLSRRIRASRNI